MFYLFSLHKYRDGKSLSPLTMNFSSSSSIACYVSTVLLLS